MRERLAFALDYPTLADAEAGAARVAEVVGVLKVGLELFVAEGPAAVRLGSRLGNRVFLDLKLHDIPETVERAVATASQLGASYLTLHAAGGPRMLEAAATRAQREGAGLKLLAVTVLTSLDAADLQATGVSATPAEHVLRLGALARGAGIHGLVCSTAEVGSLRRALGPDAILVTPGIRPAGAAAGDQKRVGTPASALKDGSSLLVVGRPIRDAADPAAAARAILAEMSEALAPAS
ncbi:MAG TPA: orotidine-5'-phosphate decarboxylase [Polyangiaceae bacterium]|nr:orotidine-5'-phosphate decarboxylase [Polyangiaceae bacterium]